MTEETKAPSCLGEVEGALFQPLFGLVEFLLYMTLTVALAWCRHPGSRVQWTRSWEVLVELGVAELGMMELVLGVGGKVLKTTTEHDRLVGGNHPGLQSINSFDQLPHVLIEIWTEQGLVPNLQQIMTHLRRTTHRDCRTRCQLFCLIC